MKVSQEPIKVTEILIDKTFSVPLYQREYSWNLDQVSDLFYDISNTGKAEGHFLGSLLLYKVNDRGEMEIVDGQQRITTLLILLRVIFDELTNTEKNNARTRIQSLLFNQDPDDLSDEIKSFEPRLQTGRRDRNLFRAIIRGDNYLVHKDGRKRSHKNLSNTLDFFKKRLEEIKKEKGIDGIIRFTEKVIRCTFVEMIAEQKSDKLMLFKTVNARGLDLTQGDLIKNELCHNIGDNEMDGVIESWDEIRGRIENNKGNLDTFLFHYINSIDYIQEERKVLDKKRGVKNWKKENYPPVPEKYMLDIYSQVIKKEGYEIFLNNILSASNHYIKYIYPSNEQIHLKSFKAMGVNKCFPLFLSTSRKLNDKNFNELVKSIESLTFRHSILRNDPKELEKFYYNLSKSIVSDDSLNEVIGEIKKHQNFRDEERFKSEFISASPKASISKMILDRICRKHSESIDWSNKDTHIEHIMPQKPGGEWQTLYENDPDLYKDYLNRLGNLTILQDRKNIQARNKDFEEKKKFYKESRLSITTHLDKFESWGYDEINKRQEELYELSEEIWK